MIVQGGKEVIRSIHSYSIMKMKVEGELCSKTWHSHGNLDKLGHMGDECLDFLNKMKVPQDEEWRDERV